MSDHYFVHCMYISAINEDIPIVPILHIPVATCNMYQAFRNHLAAKFCGLLAQHDTQKFRENVHLCVSLQNIPLGYMSNI